MEVTSEDRRGRLGELYQAHLSAVQSFFKRRLPPDEVDDLVSETFLICWRRLDEVPLGAELPWLFGVARNVLKSHWRADHRAAAALQAWTQTYLGKNGESSDVGIGIRRELIEAFKSLTPNQAEILLLSAWEGLSGAALATALNCTGTAARVRLHRARTALEKAYAEQRADASSGASLTDTTPVPTTAPGRSIV